MPRRPDPSRAAALLLAAVALLLPACGALKRCAYEGVFRDRWQQPERVVADLALAPGARVADLGAGGGYFTFRLARAVGPSGLVYAVDVDPSMVGFLTDEAAEEGLANVRPVLAADDDARLPERVDLVFTSNTYHHLENRVAYFSALRERSLAPGGRIAIIEYRPEVTSHATARKTIEQELTAAGFRLQKSFDYLERQHFLVFTEGVANPEEPAR